MENEEWRQSLDSRVDRPEDKTSPLDDDCVQVSPYGSIVEEDEIRIYTIKNATIDTAHALGLGDSQEQCQHLAAVDAGNVATSAVNWIPFRRLSRK